MVSHAVGAPYIRHRIARPVAQQVDGKPRGTDVGASRYGLTGLASTYGLPHPIGLRPDTAVIIEKGLRRQLGLLNPKVNARQEKHELVLDLDDLAVAVVPENGAGFVSLGHIASGILLGAGIGLSAWFALGASLKEIGDATRILRRLRGERKIIEGAVSDPQQAYPWRVKKERLQKAMLLENNTDKWEQRTRAVFSGGLVTAGALVEIYGYVSTPFLLGACSPAIAASSAVALTIATPMISVFAGANALLQFHRAYRSWRNKSLVASIAHSNPWGQDVFDAHKFVDGRRKQIRNHALVTGAGFLGIAAGLPVTFFAGGYGLAMLVPGIITVAIANQYESRKIEYNNPMSLKEIQHLALARHIVNDMGLAYQEYRLLKQIKVAKRSEYLAGAHMGRISRGSLAPVRWVQRRMGKARHNHESSQYTLYKFFGARLDILEEHMRHKIDGYLKHYHEADHEIHGLLKTSYNELASLQQDRAAWSGEWAHFSTVTPRVALTRMCNTLVDYGVFRDFALQVVQDEQLRPIFKATSGATTLTPKQLISRVEREGTQAHALTQRLFAIAEVLILMKVKARRHSRARELADLAMDRKRAKVILDKRHGAITPMRAPIAAGAMTGVRR